MTVSLDIKWLKCHHVGSSTFSGTLDTIRYSLDLQAFDHIAPNSQPYCLEKREV